MSSFVQLTRPVLSDAEAAILRRCIETGESAATVARDLGLSVRQAHRLKRSAYEKWSIGSPFNGFEAALASPGIEGRLARVLGVSRRTVYRMAKAADEQQASGERDQPYRLLKRYRELSGSPFSSEAERHEFESILLSQALLLQQLGRLDDARAVYVEHEERMRNDLATASFARVSLLRDDLRIPGRFAGAFDALESLLQSGGAHPLAELSFARAVLRTGAESIAHRIASAALRHVRGARDAFDAARFALDIGHLYVDLHDVAGAVSILAMTAQTIAPGDRSRWHTLAARAAHRRSEDREAELHALAVIGDLRADRRDRGEVELVLAEIASRRNDRRGAARFAEDAVASLERHAFLERYVAALDIAARFAGGSARRKQFVMYRDALRS